MKKYSCVLFDLDHTLWDFESNSKETLHDLFHEYDLQERGITSFPYFFETFTRINTHFWDLYDRGLIGQEVIREQRFHKVLSEAGLDDFRFSLKFSSHFLTELPRKQNLLPHAREVLDYLHQRYDLTIVTNGFDETQSKKMESAGIKDYFQTVVTSQRAGSKKPSREIFDFALTEVGHTASNAIMIGDNLQTDMAGARVAGIDTVYYNPAGSPHQEDVTHEIKLLLDLKKLL